MLKKRIIPILTYSNEELVKSIQFGSRKYIGDPLNAVRIFNEKFVDEIIFIRFIYIDRNFLTLKILLFNFREG